MIALGGVGQPPFLLERPAQRILCTGIVRSQFDHLLPRGKRRGVVFVGIVSGARIAPQCRVVGSQVDGLTEQLESVRAPAFQKQRQCAVGEDARDIGGSRGIPPGQIQRLTVGALRIAPSLQSAIGVAKIVQRGGHARLQSNRFLAVRQTFFGLTLIHEQLAEIAPREGKFRIKLNGGPIGLECQPDLTQLAQRRAQIILSQRVGGSHLQRGLKLLHSVRKPARIMQRQSKVIGGFGIIGLQPQRFPAAFDRLRIPSQRTISLGQIGVERGGTGTDVDRLADQLESPVEISVLMVQDAKQVQRIGIPRMPLQKGVIAACRVRKAAGPLQL